MTSAPAYFRQRRGTCPGLSVPMPSGDGLLARLHPTGTISLSAFAALCAAAQEFGNGVVEITGRGSIQIRGLTAASAPLFADAVNALAIAAEDGIPVHTDALAGLDDEEILDAGSVAADLRQMLAHTSLPARLAPKISVAIDGGGALGLDNLAADVRLCADLVNGAAVFHVGVAGNAATATGLGVVTPANGVEAARRLLEIIARHGRTARARDVLSNQGAAQFHAAIADLIINSMSFSSCPGLARASTSSGRAAGKDVDGRHEAGHDVKEAITAHGLRDGSIACGVSLAFGHTNARALEQLTQVARLIGALGFRTAPGRVLLAIGIRPADAATFTAAAEQLGFIVHPDDPRRYVVACAGAPVCAAAHIAARTLAPAVTEAARPYLDGRFRIHVSGCAKGCAHAGVASLTVVGQHDGCAIIANGSVRDAPVAFANANQLPSVIAEMMRDAKREAAHV
jgi:precorrin-3B synthase